ncbi:glycoside hydrolase family 15 protein [Streptomyces oceani]|uniref:Glycoside hydrolase n=1 Tax=Streptomyces oceani TaxID=1075402 RepID=A0A1E7KFK5_9ACTN|nr:glycoside hydrolase family 15 protein [Streptomyces oceani]OEV02664.1 glycoside hydrolase [Streptomyces oceani]
MDSDSRTPAFRANPWALREYAFLADGERGALLDPNGAVVWLCAPRWHSAAIFSVLIGGDGRYVVCPEDEWRVWGGYYEAGSLIRVSRWVTRDGVVECREALAMPATPDRLVMLRSVRAVRGDARVRLLLDPRPDFGQSAPPPLRWDGGIWSAAAGDLRLRWTGPPDASWVSEGGLHTRLELPEGTERDLVLEIRTAGAGSPTRAADDLDARRLWRATERRWRELVPDCRDVPARGDVQHAYAVLHGMTSSAGGMVAAATTSLPERANEGRNYDYRYAWLRDQSYAGIAAAAHGTYPLLDSAVRFATARVLEDGDALRPAYTVDGGRVPSERSLPLTGYPGGSDRVGNQAARQFQLDTYGEVLQLFAEAARHGRLDDDGRRAIDAAVGAVERNWQRPDAGLWELEPRWWSHSRLSVVVGLRALVRQVPGPSAARWSSLADGILRETRRRCLRPDGAWARAADDPSPDAGLLLPLARGALEANAPSALATRELVREQLTQEGFVYRFRHDDRPLYQAEGAFLLCGFMMALVTASDGEQIAAYRWFERTRSAYGPAGLFAEEYDVIQRQLRGNLPQAFVHALLLEAAVRLGDSGPG